MLDYYQLHFLICLFIFFYLLQLIELPSESREDMRRPRFGEVDFNAHEDPDLVILNLDFAPAAHGHFFILISCI